MDDKLFNELIESLREGMGIIRGEINLTKTSCCNKEIKLKLFPDYCSSGIWCYHCGCGLSSLQLPDGLINLCEVWNNLWDHQINKTAYIDDEYFIKIFMSTGNYLCELINKYCYCEFNYSEEQLRHDIIFDREQLKWFHEYTENKRSKEDD